MNIDQNLLEKQILQVTKRKYGELMAENIKLEAIQQVLLVHIHELESIIASNKGATKSKTVNPGNK